MQPNILSRAFELAPQCGSSQELRQRLAAEGYSRIAEHLGGLGTQRQLRKLFNDGAGQQKRGPKRQSAEPQHAQSVEAQA
jgi:hypothetical protein